MGESDYPTLFSHFNLGRHTLKNRVVALPVHTGFAYPDGRTSPWMMEFYSQLARTGAGMVIVANASVSPDGAVSRFNLRADRDKYIVGLARLANAIKHQGALAGIQLNHAGRFARISRPLLPSPISSSNLTFNVESLKQFMEFFPFEKRFSLTRYFLQKVTSWRQAMTEVDRKRVTEDFASAAQRAYQAGFETVELHGANGYLLCQYLSSFTNQEAADETVPFRRRLSFPLSVFEAVKNVLPRDFPVGFRILLREWVPGGIDLEEALEFAASLEKAGCAYLSASVGTYNSIFSPRALKTMAKPAYLAKEMKALKAHVTIPVIASGRIIRPSIADRILQQGVTDLIGLGRPLRTDPGWLKKARTDEKQINICINCNWCLKQVVLEKGFTCARWPEALRRRSSLEHMLLTRNYNSVWVISSPEEIEVYKQCWPLISPDKSRHTVPTIAILRSPEEDTGFDAAARKFVQWVKQRIDPLSLTDVPNYYNMWADKTDWEEVLTDEIGVEDYGQVFMVSNPSEPWKKKMLYRERGRICSLLGKNRHICRIAVAVDFSQSTLLLMRFLRQNLMQRNGLEFFFIYVDTREQNQTHRKWETFKKIAGFDESVPLEVLWPDTDVSSSLIAFAHREKCGTIVMGKRGLSGIKRWLLGSVSSKVLKELKDRTIFLID